jgi:hypothetical protein
MKRRLAAGVLCVLFVALIAATGCVNRVKPQFKTTITNETEDSCIVTIYYLCQMADFPRIAWQEFDSPPILPRATHIMETYAQCPGALGGRCGDRKIRSTCTNGTEAVPEHCSHLCDHSRWSVRKAADGTYRFEKQSATAKP